MKQEGSDHSVDTDVESMREMNISVFILSALIAGSCWVRIQRTFDA